MTAGPLVVVFSGVESLLASAASLPREAAGLLQLVATQRVPLVLSSTRTRAELGVVCQELGIRTPFVFENGAAVWIPPEYFTGDLPQTRAVAGGAVAEFGRPHGEVVSGLKEAASQLGMSVVGVSDLSTEAVALEWGLSPLEASRAKAREYGEPFRIVRGLERRAALFRALRARGFGSSTGGRSDYVGAPVGEGPGIDLLIRLYRQTFGAVLTVGVGSPNYDAELLRRVDVPIFVWRRPGAPPPRIMKSKSLTWTDRLLAQLGVGRVASAGDCGQTVSD